MIGRRKPPCEMCTERPVQPHTNVVITPKGGRIEQHAAPEPKRGRAR